MVCVSMQNILAQVPTSKVKAITLSANERHIGNISQLGDSMGLQWALLQIGIENVIAPMWSVSRYRHFLCK